MHALLRVDGGPTIGYGHLMRMRALTEALQAAGHAVRVATATPAPARAVLPDAVSVEPLPARDAPAPLLACIDRCAPDVVVTDAYPVDTATQQAVRTAISYPRYDTKVLPNIPFGFSKKSPKPGIIV
jgi:spore coat polysaccharide biosynthesis predicted glycosyltransferase SpsG